MEPANARSSSGQAVDFFLPASDQAFALLRRTVLGVVVRNEFDFFEVRDIGVKFGRRVTRNLKLLEAGANS